MRLVLVAQLWLGIAKSALNPSAAFRKQCLNDNCLPGFNIRSRDGDLLLNIKDSKSTLFHLLWGSPIRSHHSGCVQEFIVLDRQHQLVEQVRKALQQRRRY